MKFFVALVPSPMTWGILFFQSWLWIPECHPLVHLAPRRLVLSGKTVPLSLWDSPSSILDRANCQEVRHGSAGWNEPSSPQAFLLNLFAHWWAFWRKRKRWDRHLLDCLYLDFFLFSDGWVKRRYRPNVQQFAGRDGSPDSGKFSSLTFKLGEGGQCYQMWFYMTRELSF